jgi:hypothetical protein
VLYHVLLKRRLRFVIIDCCDPKKRRYAVLASTDTALGGKELYRLYRVRFQIEFIFHRRDTVHRLARLPSPRPASAGLSLQCGTSDVGCGMSRSHLGARRQSRAGVFDGQPHVNFPYTGDVVRKELLKKRLDLQVPFSEHIYVM